MEKFDKWDKRFIEMSELVGSWSSCYKTDRKVGAIIVKDKRILTTGYNGACSGVESCVERQECLRQQKGIKSGTMQEVCYAVHAEQNAIIQAGKLGVCINEATLYCTHQPCVICGKMIINAGIKRVVYKHGYPDEFSLQMFKESDVKIEKFEE